MIKQFEVTMGIEREGYSDRTFLISATDEESAEIFARIEYYKLVTLKHCSQRRMDYDEALFDAYENCPECGEFEAACCKFLDCY